jgi:cytochrome c-type biogenesis protein CcmH
MEIVFIVFTFIALLLFIVWMPFFRKKVSDTENYLAKQNLRDETNVVLYKEHKVEIEKDFSNGAIDEENYQYLLAELDNSLLQDITVAEKKSNISPDISQEYEIFSSIKPFSFSILTPTTTPLPKKSWCQ